MSFFVVFHEAAELELMEAADYYDIESPGLGSLLIDEIQNAVDNIQLFPESNPILKNRVRRKILIKFPYSILFSVNNNEIRILAVAHHKRRPGYWNERR
jgi:plasmid stabilization system protein ParE